MARTLKDYLLVSKKDYTYRLKLNMPITDAVISRIEKVLNKWKLVNISKPSKNIIQKNPTDFNLQNAEIYYIDFTVEYPASQWLLLHTIREALGLAETEIVVKLLEDGQENNTQLNDFTKLDHDDYYGTGYNSKFVETLNKHQKEVEHGLSQNMGYKEKDDEIDKSHNFNSPLGTNTINKEIKSKAKL